VALVVLAVAGASPARADGYVIAPPSRQALCAAGTVPDCGQIGDDPAGVEAPKGSRQCSGGEAAFAVLDDETRYWPSTAVGAEVTFSWTLTSRPATDNWVYYVDGQRVAAFDDDGAVPGAVVTHQVDVGAYSGEHTVLAVWNIADAANAFYACVDLDIGADEGDGDDGVDVEPSDGAGSGSQSTDGPTASATATSAAAGPGATDIAGTPDPAGGTATATGGADRGDWRDWTWYERGDTVSYQGVSYLCRQEHTGLPGWEPSNVRSLWAAQ